MLISEYRFAKCDEFIQVNKVCMDKLKKLLIRNGLPTKELEDLSAKYKVEIKAMAEELVERYRKKV